MKKTAIAVALTAVIAQMGETRECDYLGHLDNRLVVLSIV